MTTEATQSSDLISLTADIVSAHVSNNKVSTSDVAGLIQTIHASLSGLNSPAAAPDVKPEPAVSIRSSVKPDHIVCLEDGKKLKMLKRYLRTNYDMSPEEYRAKWGLPRDYPMVAPDYAEQRRGLAHKIGLGRKKVEQAVAPAQPKANKVAKTRGRPKKATKAADPAPEAIAAE